MLSIVQFWKDWQETEQRRLASEAEDSPAGSDPDTEVAMDSELTAVAEPEDSGLSDSDSL